MKVNKTEKQELFEKLNLLLKKQLQFQQEINELQRQIVSIRISEEKIEATPKAEPVKFESIEPSNQIKKEIQNTSVQPNIFELIGAEIKTVKSGISAEMEKFIGENLINKIGIAIVIIGVGIGVKYAIDNDLISPLVRIILGYLVGFALAGFAIRLKAKYHSFSAVLFSGAMAIQYFISYAAYSFYNLYPQIIAVLLMVITTILTVALALYYNQQVIAHFGLVGAYIVPFLLKEPFLNVTVLFIYMVIINSGILFISTRKKWKPLNYLAFLATWIIFISWFKSENYNDQLATCLIFLSLFFAIFYLVFLSNKLLLKEKFSIDDIFLLLFNSSVLYIIGYLAIDSHESSKTYLGLFTFINAIIHGVTAYLIYNTKSSDKKLFYWTIGLVIGFFTLAISVQFNNSVTTILWSLEAALIFWYGRGKKINLFENISYLLIFITTLATAINWTSTTYSFHSGNIEKIFNPVFNLGFLTSLIVILSFGFITYFTLKSNKNDKNTSAPKNIFNVLFPVIFLLVLYFTFFTEISLYWNNVQINASFEINSDGIWEKQVDKLNFDIIKFRGIWLLNYTLLFASLLSIINFKWIKNSDLNAFTLVINFLLIVVFLVSGLNQLSALGASYTHPELNPDYAISINHLIIRYISLAFFAILMYSTYRFVIIGFHIVLIRRIFEIALSISIIWIFSSELISWLSISGSTEIYKHWLSILWGAFSLILVSYGIWKRKKHLRIFAIILFTGTLIKLFFYDLTNLETVPKTMVFLFTGVLLLIVSFLYNKYTKMIFE